MNILATGHVGNRQIRTVAVSGVTGHLEIPLLGECVALTIDSLHGYSVSRSGSLPPSLRGPATYLPCPQPSLPTGPTGPALFIKTNIKKDRLSSGKDRVLSAGVLGLMSL